MQVAFAFRELEKFQNKVFIYNGLDKSTGYYPFEVRLITFIIFTRSIFQYARKEAENDTKKLNAYNWYLRENTIISFFKHLRDHEIHSLSITTHTTITFTSKLITDEEPTATIEERTLNTSASQNGKIEQRIDRRLEITDALIKKLRDEGKKDLIAAINKGEPLFETVEFEGDSDMFSLCKNYFDTTQKFVDYGISKGFIT